MMKVIWKYPIEVNAYQRIAMPFGAEILTVQRQGKSVCLWARVNPENIMAQRTVVVHPTGIEFEEYPNRYIGTFQIDGGAPDLPRVRGAVVNVSLERSNSLEIPADIFEAERKLSQWFAENNIEDWQLGDCAARPFTEDDICRRAADILRAEVKRLEQPKAMFPQEAERIARRQAGFEAAIRFLDPK